MEGLLSSCSVHRHYRRGEEYLRFSLSFITTLPNPPGDHKSALHALMKQTAAPPTGQLAFISPLCVGRLSIAALNVTVRVLSRDQIWCLRFSGPIPTCPKETYCLNSLGFYKRQELFYLDRRCWHKMICQGCFLAWEVSSKASAGHRLLLPLGPGFTAEGNPHFTAIFLCPTTDQLSVYPELHFLCQIYFKKISELLDHTVAEILRLKGSTLFAR